MQIGSPAEAPSEWPPHYVVSICLVALVLGLISGLTIAKQLNARDEVAAKETESAAGPAVQTTLAVLGGQERIISSLGEARPYIAVTMYAKVSGYLRALYVDKGDVVRKGQVLAQIDAPETFSQYEGAVANSKNRRSISERATKLNRQRVVSDEETDIAQGAADVATARLKELNAQKDYSTLRAPFDGTVTARFVDPGALMQDATGARTGAQPIVTVSQTNRLRITIFIDQKDAAFVQPGDPAQLTISERPDQHFQATVTRKSNDLDAKSRTMLTEIEFDNTNEEIVPGSFLDVKLKIRTPGLVQLPTEALISRGIQTDVVVVASDGTLHYRAIKQGEVDGKIINILSGVDQGERVVLNPGNNLSEGQHVQFQ